MAIRDNGITTYEGQVFDKFEHNGYDDSDFYALVWDDEVKSVLLVEYATTRAYSTGSAKVDATEDTLAKIRAWARPIVVERLHNDSFYKANKINNGNMVEVVKGRKHKGVTGKVFWVGEKAKYLAYQGTETWLGIALDEEKVNGKYKNVVFVKEEYCTRLDVGNIKPIEEIDAELDENNVISLMYGYYGYRWPKRVA